MRIVRIRSLALPSTLLLAAVAVVAWQQWGRGKDGTELAKLAAEVRGGLRDAPNAARAAYREHWRDAWPYWTPYAPYWWYHERRIVTQESTGAPRSSRGGEAGLGELRPAFPERPEMPAVEPVPREKVPEPPLAPERALLDQPGAGQRSPLTVPAGLAPERLLEREARPRGNRI